jgi:lipoprotein NlpI
MALDRLKQLQEFYDEDPTDPFNLYALAIEYLKHNPHISAQLFQDLLDKHSDYLPTYYHAAKLYAELGELEKASTVYELGIALATRLNDMKARRELKSAYDELMF